MLKLPLPLTVVALSLTALACDAGAAGQAGASLVDYSLEQLADIVVTSVSRQETRLADAPASIYLISAADIRRAGAATLPEALRLAPNLQVAQSDARNYAITARGFSSNLENKLLVLIDGRSVYSPLFSGVFWDAQDVAMEDIERIEVISGPGATIWGANAVNGVINIITRPAADTQGGLVAVSAGARLRSATARYGLPLSNGGHYRVYARHTDAAQTFSEAGAPGRNDWRRQQAGFRADWDGPVHDVTVSGDAYQGALSSGAGPDTRIAGANLLGRIDSRLADGSDLRLQAYLDHTERDQDNTGAQLLDTVDVEVQHGAALGAAHQLVWGGGYRYSRDRLEGGPLLQFSPAERALHWGNVFAQDEIRLHEALRLTLGLKFEHNTYTGMEALPNVHLAWKLRAGQLLWAGVSRTVRTPSRIDRDLWLVDARNSTPAAPRYTIAGGPQFDAETARVAELGYRGQQGGAFSYAATLFYSDYDRLRTLEPVAGGGAQFRNFGRGNARGLEMWSRWQVRDDWRLSGGLVLQDVRTHLAPGSQDSSGGTGLATNDPSHYWSLRSSHDLADDLQADLLLRAVGSLPRPAVPGYSELDARLAWQPRRDLELSLAGHNLLHRSHAEFGTAGTRQMIERAVSVKLALRF
ncbi:TonB-dependent receptor [Massilia sp. R2A-15]|uniref:TonB-dependent receptor plug domain-containing protein n=1 Tax=Massilia sp. R2A-15 TaxID=3064278 RepID=UPI0027333F6C|nr:TonB-dependent receptor [Massilia sp. R2A-15]WLI90887.1 TonB-dependent receptor [Massilia sp. R2A-15]